MRLLHEKSKLMCTLGFVVIKPSQSRCRHRRASTSRAVYNEVDWMLPKFRSARSGIQRHEIHCWWLSHSSAEAFARIKPLCSPFLTSQEIEEFTSCKDARVGELRYIARAFARSVLLRYLDWPDMPPCALEFSRNNYGKPAISARHRSSLDLRFNLSHTQGLIAMAVTNGLEVGIDAEKISRRTRRNITKVANRWFSVDESKHLASKSNSKRSPTAC